MLVRYRTYMYTSCPLLVTVHAYRQAHTCRIWTRTIEELYPLLLYTRTEHRYNLGIAFIVVDIIVEGVPAFEPQRIVSLNCNCIEVDCGLTEMGIRVHGDVTLLDQPASWLNIGTYGEARLLSAL
jgi:hypothetical protein